MSEVEIKNWITRIESYWNEVK